MQSDGKGTKRIPFKALTEIELVSPSTYGTPLDALKLPRTSWYHIKDVIR